MAVVDKDEYLPNGPVSVLKADGTFDHRLLFGMADSPGYLALVTWAKQTPGLHPFVQDFHRLQVEYWVWLQAAQAQARHDGPVRVLDVGQYQPRAWMGEGYRTMGLDPDGGHDYLADLTERSTLPTDPFDVVVATEVLEHTVDPSAALRNLSWLLRPAGVLIASTPFLWPDHRTVNYPDFWRFTEQGWQLLLKDWTDVVVQPCAWSRMGRHAYTLLADAECMGQQTVSTSGYLISARATDAAATAGGV